MCDPVSAGLMALSGALSAGSMFANQKGAEEQASARDGVIGAEAGRTRGTEAEANNLFNQTLNKVTPATTEAQVKAEADKRTAEDSALIDQGGNFTPPTGSAPKEVGEQIARAGAAAIDRAKGQARLNANVSAVGGVRQKQGIDIGRDAAWQDIFAKRIRNSGSILPLELEEANRAGSTARGIGSLLSAGASVAGMAGMSGAGESIGGMFSSGGGPADYGKSFAGASAGGPGARQAPGFFARLWSR